VSLDQLNVVAGSELCAFIAAATPEVLDRAVGGESGALSERQAEAANHAWAWINENIDRLRTDVPTALASYDSGEGTSVANVFHREAGGEFPEIDESDHLLNLLLTVARDAYPALLRPPDSANALPLGRAPFRGLMLGDVSLGLSAAIYQHPLHSELATAIAADEDFAPALHSEAAPGPLWIAGTGGSVKQAEILGMELIGAAANDMLARSLPFQIGAFVGLVRDNVGRVRQLLHGETVDGWLVVGVSGLKLPDGASLSTPWGTVRPANRRQQLIQPFGSAGTAVLTSSFPLVLRLVAQGEQEPADTSFSERVERMGKLLPLASLLATNHDPRVAPLIAWRTLLTPWDASPGMSASSLPSFPQAQPPELTQADLAEVENWSRRVEQNYRPSIDIAIRRTLSAIAERQDPGDGLIDAVMAWENLCGAGMEVRFRVSAALAHLLESDPAQRLGRQKRLAKIYNLRSRIVHGSDTGATQVHNARGEAIEVAIGALRRFFSDRSDLLALNESQARGDHLLLGL
jgi:hypothetical protein